MWPLAASMIGLITLMAADDTLAGRSASHTWLATLSVIGGLGLVVVAAVVTGRLLS